MTLRNLGTNVAGLNNAIAQSVAVVDNGTVSPNTILGGVRNGSAVASDVTGGILLNPGGVGYNNVVGGDGSATVGTTTPNTSRTGTGANQSVIGGYDNVAGHLSSKIIADHSWTEYGTGTSQGHNAIYGGAHHVIREAANFSAIVGGQSNDVAGAYSLVTGNTNVLTANADSAFAFGNNHTVDGVGTLTGGASNSNSAPYAFVLGQLNDAGSANHFSAALGQYASSRVRGQWTWAVGRFATTGDAQHSTGVWTLQTTDATASQRLKPGGLGAYYNIPVSQSCMVEAHVVARSTSGTVQGAWIIRGAAYRNATGNSTIIGTPLVETLYADGGLTAPTLLAASSAGQVSVRVTGLAATTINWMGRVTITEVGNI